MRALPVKYWARPLTEAWLPARAIVMSDALAAWVWAKAGAANSSAHAVAAKRLIIGVS
jgi:hypothetical protein